MQPNAPEGPNAAQIAYWNAEAGKTWTQMQEALDLELEPLGQAVMRALAPKAGENLIDIGCGGGTTTLDLAGHVGPLGRVLGVDISSPLLAVAERRGLEAGLANVAFSEADAQTHSFAGDADGIFSRFGVMFFSQPEAAFANLRSALKTGGRLAFVCWRKAAESQCMSLPMAAAISAAPEIAPAPGDPLAPGPFAFADPERLRGILKGAGFRDVNITAYDQPVTVGDVDATLAFSMRVGMLGALLREAPQHRLTVTDAVRAALENHVIDGQVWLGAATWVVTAKT